MSASDLFQPAGRPEEATASILNEKRAIASKGQLLANWKAKETVPGMRIELPIGDSAMEIWVPHPKAKDTWVCLERKEINHG